MLLAENLPPDSRSVSSLDSCSSDQLLKSQDISVLSKPTAVLHCSSSCTNNESSGASRDVRVHESTRDMPSFLSRELSSCSPKSKEGFLRNDINLASESNGLELSCDNTVHAHNEILQSASSCLLTDKNADAQNTTESTLSLLDCDTNSTVSLVTMENRVPENSVTSLESSVDICSQNSPRLSTFDAVNNRSSAFDLGLCISADSAVESNNFMATVMSPSEDFQSIYASNSYSLTASAIADKTCISESETIHSYSDLDSIDAWLEFPLPGKSTALSLSVSSRTAWYVDKAEHLYCSSLKGPGLSWKPVDQPAQQISCSPSGSIVWRVYRGSAFSAVGKITGKSAAGTEWREVAREVAYVAVDDSVVWYSI